VQRKDYKLPDSISVSRQQLKYAIRDIYKRLRGKEIKIRLWVEFMPIFGQITRVAFADPGSLRRVGDPGSRRVHAHAEVVTNPSLRRRPESRPRSASRPSVALSGLTRRIERLFLIAVIWERPMDYKLSKISIRFYRGSLNPVQSRSDLPDLFPELHSCLLVDVSAGRDRFSGPVN